jgi:predicted RNA-binding Zn-ribbon protein involved in translation (DUF1610 family)
MPKPKRSGSPALCLFCGAFIDTDAASRAFRLGEQYRHPECGRILVKAENRA